jgi:hypothetical protein
MKELSRKPERIGDTYCSPTCGMGCTYDEYEKATNDAKALARKMGRRWMIFVWENLGWHYQVVHDSYNFNIRKSSKDFVCSFKNTLSITNKNPILAFKDMLKEIEGERDELNGVIDDANK